MTLGGSAPRTTDGDRPSGRDVRYAVRGRVLLRSFAPLAIILGAVVAVPAAVALPAAEWSAAWRYAVPGAALAVAGWLLSRLRATQRIQANEAMVLAALVFVIAPLAMLPAMMHAGLGVGDALLEAVSGVTTTGLTTVEDVEAMPASFRFARAWMQWFGGLGIIVLCVALVTAPGLLARSLSTTTLEEYDFVGGAKQHARRVLIVYSGLTVAAFGVLTVTGTGPFDAACYALSSVSTGGFSPRNESLASLDGWVARSAVLLTCLLCAVPTLLHRRLSRSAWRQMPRDLQTRGVIVAALLCGVVLLLLMRFEAGRPWAGAVHDGLMLGVSAQTTAGFAPCDVEGLGPAAKLALVVSMLVGGGMGSTAGGIKILRALIVLRLVQMSLRRIGVAPHAVTPLRLGGQRIGDTEIRAACAVAALYAALLVLSWFAFLGGGHDPLDSLFEVVSAIGTVGLSSGVTDADLATWLKGVLMLDMLLGRLEIVAVLVLLSPRTWFGRRMTAL